MSSESPSRRARLRAGLDLHKAARRARITHAYLAACERANSFSWVLAQRLARIYGARVDDFLPRPVDVRNRAAGAAGPRSKRAGGRAGAL